MPKRYSTKQVLKVLNMLGFFRSAQAGSHIKLQNEKGLPVTVPDNRKVLTAGTFCSILKQAKLTRGEFESLLEKKKKNKNKPSTSDNPNYRK